MVDLTNQTKSWRDGAKNRHRSESIQMFERFLHKTTNENEFSTGRLAFWTIVSSNIEVSFVSA